MTGIAYREGYLYQLAEDYCVRIEIRPEQPIWTEYIELSPEGDFLIRHGYAWDGASWAIDTPNFMRGSLVHDALYQFMRAGKLDSYQHRKTADAILRRICREDGMSAIRAWWVYQGVRFGGGPGATPGNENPVIYAP